MRRSNFHEDITWDLIELVEDDQFLKMLLEKSIRKAQETVNDLSCCPVKDLESYYSFIDHAVLAMPWDIYPTQRFGSLYWQIDQSMGCLYFVSDQPLEELEDRGYLYNCLIYHEPFRSWFVKFLKQLGSFLDDKRSWSGDYYHMALAEKSFHLDDGTYEDPKNWKSFNDFFARRLKDPSARPIESPDDEDVIISPTDAIPQGIWQIDERSRIIGNDQFTQIGITIKSGTLTDVSVLLGESAFKDVFAGGTLTHTLLDINDYHRYHFPLSGEVKEIFVIGQDDAPGGVITWNPVTRRFKEYFSETVGWQSIETRGVCVVKTDDGGYAAIVPVGMCQVSSVVFEEGLKPGVRVKKGDALGCFRFGGSDVIMIFSKELDFRMTCEKDEHLLMGKAYGRIR